MTQRFRLMHAMVALTVAGALLPTNTAAQKVSYDFNRTANFAQVRAFAIRPSDKMSENELVNDRITSAIAGTLAGRGMTSSSNPDVFIVPSIATETRRQVTSYGPGWYEPFFGYGYYGGWYGWGVSGYEVRDVQYATLTIDMVDARTGALLWRGRGVRSVNPQWKPDTVDRKVFKAVTKIFRNFPPGRDDN
jgi:hypothetical protein